MTRLAINNSIWAVGLVLQFGLLALVFLRGIASRLPTFTILLAFYPSRATVLYFFSGHIAADNYLSLYQALSLVALLLELSVAAQVSWKLWRLVGSRRWLILIAPIVAAACALGLSGLLPEKAPLPPDRVEIFFSVMMIQLCVVALSCCTEGFLQRVTAGLGVFGLVDLLAMTGKSLAAAHRDAASFTGWSYATTGVYLVVVIFWMMSLKPASEACDEEHVHCASTPA